jgi:hypothetical protein
VSRPGRALASGKGPPVPIVQEAGWAPTARLDTEAREKSFRLCRGSNLNRPVVQLIARHYTNLATRLMFRRLCFTLLCVLHTLSSMRKKHLMDTSMSVMFFTTMGTKGFH